MKLQFSVRSWFLVVVAAAALAATSCGGGAQPPAPQPSAPVAQPAPTTAPTAPAAEPKAPAVEPEKQAAIPEGAATPRKRATQPENRGAGRSTTEPPLTPTEPPPAREPVIKTVPAGTAIEVSFLDGVSSKGSRAGDSFRARVAKDVVEDGIVVIPVGSVVVGSVTEAVSLKKIGGQAKLGLAFDRLELTSGRNARISASFAEAGKKETGRDAATIGGAAAGGALLGRLLSKDDKGKGTVLGALVGAAAGTAIAAKTKGEEIEIPAGTVITLKLDQAVQIAVLP